MKKKIKVRFEIPGIKKDDPICVLEYPNKERANNAVNIWKSGMQQFGYKAEIVNEL